MSNSDYVNEDTSTSSVESEKNIYCSNNGQQPNGQQPNGQQSNGQQSHGQQSNGRLSNGQQSNVQQSNGQQWNWLPWNGHQWNGQPWSGQQSNGQQSNISSDFYSNIARRGPELHHRIEAEQCVRKFGDHPWSIGYVIPNENDGMCDKGLQEHSVLRGNNPNDNSYHFCKECFFTICRACSSGR